jgi:Ca2+-binding EF-hand superfamily protein
LERFFGQKEIIDSHLNVLQVKLVQLQALKKLIKAFHLYDQTVELSLPYYQLHSVLDAKKLQHINFWTNIRAYSFPTLIIIP